MVHLTAALLVLNLLAVGLPPSGPEPEDMAPAQHVSILALALDCSSFDGSRVTVIGAASIGFEAQALCPTKEFLSADHINCLWVSTDDVFGKQALESVGEKVTVGDYLLLDATVSCENRGFGGLYGGALEAITLVVVNETGHVLWSADPALALPMEPDPDCSSTISDGSLP